MGAARLIKAYAVPLKAEPGDKLYSSHGPCGEDPSIRWRIDRGVNRRELRCVEHVRDLGTQIQDTDIPEMNGHGEGHIERQRPGSGYGISLGVAELAGRR